jgi:hypothetical protein
MKFLTTTGLGSEIVEVSYDIDDGVVFDVEIKWQGKEISGLLSEDVNADIELECYAHQRKLDKIEAANCELDRGQARYEDRFINKQLEAA